MVDINLNWKTVAAGVAGIVLLGWLAKREAGEALAAVNPVDPDNVINQGANEVFQAVSGNEVDSIGTWLYGLLHPHAGEAITAPTPLNWNHAQPPKGTLP